MRALSSAAITALATGNFGGSEVITNCTSFCDEHLSGRCTSLGNDIPCITHDGLNVCKDLYWENSKKRSVYILDENSIPGIPVECEPSSTKTEAPEPSSTTTEAPEPSSTTTEAPEPSSTTTEAPEPSSTTTEAPEPSSTTTEAPEPSSTTTEAPEPSSTTTEAPEPSSTTTEAPEPSSTTTEAPEPSSTTTEAPEPSSTTTEAPEPSSTKTEAPTTSSPTGKPEPVLDQCIFGGKKVECRDYRIVPICRGLYWTDSTYQHICRDIGYGKCGYGDSSTPVRCKRKIQKKHYKARNSCDRFCNEYGNNRCTNNHYHIQCRADRHVCRGLYTDANKTSICIDPADAFCGLPRHSPFTIAVPC